MVKFYDPLTSRGGGHKEFDIDYIAKITLLKAGDAYLLGEFDVYNRGIMSLFNLFSGRVEKNKKIKAEIEALDKELPIDPNTPIHIETNKMVRLQRIIMRLIEHGQEEILYDA